MISTKVIQILLEFCQIGLVLSGFACLRGPCLNGICIDQLNSTWHECYCINGFTGYSCQINWNECNVKPCRNGGTCIDGIASFNCSCPDNFVGTLCEYDASECNAYRKCQNNGTCLFDRKLIVPGRNGSGFYCSCPKGFKGELCQEDISMCNSTANICQNGGQCIDGVGDKFQCMCPPGWVGEFCETNFDECSSAPCQNGGICIDSINDFKCACPFSYTGKLCELKLQICPVNPCQNGGFCLEENGSPVCYCVPDFHGKLCEEQYNECEPGPKCFNGGTCIDGVGGFNCSCPPNYYGNFCQCYINSTDLDCQLPESSTSSPANESISETFPPFWTSTATRVYPTPTPSVTPSMTPTVIPSMTPPVDDTAAVTPTAVDQTEGASPSPSDTDQIELTPTATLVTSSLDYETSIQPSLTDELSPTVFSSELITPWPSETTSVVEETIEPTATISVSSTMEWNFTPEPSEDIETLTLSPTISDDVFSTATPALSDELITSSEFSSTFASTAEYETIIFTPTPSEAPEPSATGPWDEVTPPIRNYTEFSTEATEETSVTTAETDETEITLPSWTPTQSTDNETSEESESTTELSLGTSFSTENGTRVTEDSTVTSPTSPVTEDSTGTSPTSPVTEDSIGTSPTSLVTEDSTGTSPSSPVSEESTGKSPSSPITEESTGTSSNSPVTEVSTVTTPSSPVTEESTGTSSSTLVTEESTVTSPSSPVTLSASTPEPADNETSVETTSFMPSSTSSTENTTESGEPRTDEGGNFTLSPTMSPTMKSTTEGQSSTTQESGSTVPATQETPADSESTQSTDLTVTSSTTETHVRYNGTEVTQDNYGSTTEGISTETPGVNDTLTSTEGYTGITTISEEPITSWTTGSPSSTYRDEENVTLSTESTTIPGFNESSSATPDPCLNYCQNSGKCIRSALGPICLCGFKFNGIRCEIPSEKVIIPALRGNSFLKYKVPARKSKLVDVSLKMATVVPDGIVLYTSPVTTGQSSNQSASSYALIFIKNGHLVLHFSCGSQSMEFVETRTRVNNGRNFTLDLKFERNQRVRNNVTEIYCLGKLSVKVNGTAFVMSGEQLVKNGTFPSYETIFIGGVEPTIRSRDDHGSDVIAFASGFRGCLSQVTVNNAEMDMFDDAQDGNDITECETFACVTNPCFGNSKCVPSVSPPFWECICPPGYDGLRCQIKVCIENPCQNGATCTEGISLTNSSWSEGNVTCLCPLGFSGHICGSRINITKPSFHPTEDYSSYISYYGLPHLHDWFQMKFHFVTGNLSQIALLLYIGNPITSQVRTDQDQIDQIEKPFTSTMTSTSSPSSFLDTIPDFFSLSFIQGFLGITWNLGSGIRRIVTPSKIDSRLQIHTIYFGRAGRQTWLKVDGMRNVTGRSPGPMYRLNVDEELYLGGHESYRLEGLPGDLPFHIGFQGCIFDLGLRVKNKLFIPKAFKGRNVKNCFEDC